MPCSGVASPAFKKNSIHQHAEIRDDVLFGLLLPLFFNRTQVLTITTGTWPPFDVTPKDCADYHVQAGHCCRQAFLRYEAGSRS